MTYRYLTNSDYRYTIQNSQLNQLLQIPGVGGRPLNTLPQADNMKLIQAERIAMDEVSSYLRQRWDMDREFTPVKPWAFTASYQMENRVILDYATFSATVDYATGSCVISEDGYAYMSQGNSATSSVPVNGASWTQLGYQYDMFYVKNEYPIYNDSNSYSLGDVTYWKGHTWSANYTTTVLSPESMIQYKRLEYLPAPNYTPGTNATKWIDGGTFSMSGVLPTDSSKWICGDNRCQQIMVAVQDVALYHLHKSISPENVPELRLTAYTLALKMLKMAAFGDITLSLPELEPTQGLKTRYFGDIRKTNNI